MWRQSFPILHNVFWRIAVLMHWVWCITSKSVKCVPFMELPGSSLEFNTKSCQLSKRKLWEYSQVWTSLHCGSNTVNLFGKNLIVCSFETGCTDNGALARDWHSWLTMEKASALCTQWDLWMGLEDCDLERSPCAAPGRMNRVIRALGKESSSILCCGSYRYSLCS